MICFPKGGCVSAANASGWSVYVEWGCNKAQTVWKHVGWFFFVRLNEFGMLGRPLFLISSLLEMFFSIV